MTPPRRPDEETAEEDAAEGAAGEQAAEEQRYPLRNATDREARRLALLESLSDPITIRWFEDLGVGPGWDCAELGAGAGSMVAWLAGRVEVTGSVTAVDRDTSQLGQLAAEWKNVHVVEADLCAMAWQHQAFDLVHSRSVLMHLACPDRVVAGAVAALRPGGLVFFEETDGAPASGAVDAPDPYHRVMAPLAARWKWVGGLAALLEALGMEDVRDDVRQDPLVGGGPAAAFWKLTLASMSELRQEAGTVDDGFDEALAAMSVLLDDPSFAAPFTARHRVTARHPLRPAQPPAATSRRTSAR